MTSTRRCSRVVVARAAAATLAGCATNSIGTGAALEAPPPHGWSIAVQVDAPFTDGLEILRVAPGQGPVTIERVEVLGTDALEVEGFQLAGPERTFGGVQFFDAFPPDGDTDPDRRSRLAQLHPIDTDAPFDVAEHEHGTELLLGLRATSTGRHERSGIRIVYTSDGVTSQQDFPAELVVCAHPEITTHDGCE